MHPIVAEQIASDRSAGLLAAAEVHRRLRGARPARRAPAWRGLPARWLVTLARRLDPSIEERVAAAG